MSDDQRPTSSPQDEPDTRCLLAQLAASINALKSDLASLDSQAGGEQSDTLQRLAKLENLVGALASGARGKGASHAAHAQLESAAGVPFPFDDLKALVEAEHALRSSAACQSLIRRAEDNEWESIGVESWLELMSILQAALCARFLRWLAARDTSASSSSAAVPTVTAFTAPPAVLAGDALRYLAAPHSRSIGRAAKSGEVDRTDMLWFCSPASTPLRPGGAVLTVAELRWAIKQLHTASKAHPELAPLQIFVHANRTTRGRLRNGDPAPDISLTDAYSGAATSLHELVRSQPVGPTGRKKPVVVLAASYT